MAALKILVVVMGVMLVGGTALLVALIVTRGGRHEAAIPEPGAPWRRSLALGSDGRIVGLAGLGDRLAIAIDSRSGASVVVVDPRSGAVLGTIAVSTPEPTGP